MITIPTEGEDAQSFARFALENMTVRNRAYLKELQKNTTRSVFISVLGTTARDHYRRRNPHSPFEPDWEKVGEAMSSLVDED